MENVNTYIESGVLELYAMGDLTAAERLEVETMAKNYPAVAAELSKIENSFVDFATKFAVEPSNRVKESFFNQIGFDNNIEIDLEPVSIKKQAKEIQLYPQKSINFYKYSFAASFTLLVISVVALILLYNNLQQSKFQIAQLQSNNQSFANRVNYLQNQVKITQNSMSIFSNPDVKTVRLAGTANSPKSKMIVMWNAKEQKVMIDLQTMDMPLTDTKHQYQLWALVNGKPVDLGVFDAKGQITGVQEMKNIEIAQTFAVTLEPRGGSLNPTMSQLMVVGNIM
ncbi:MAG: anti-sigma factor [Sphingobacteriales bacterium]|nr:MAG: anti-sigma factor [Sphingobacteriales bacterium]